MYTVSDEPIVPSFFKCSKFREGNLGSEAAKLQVRNRFRTCKVAGSEPGPNLQMRRFGTYLTSKRFRTSHNLGPTLNSNSYYNTNFEPTSYQLRNDLSNLASVLHQLRANLVPKIVPAQPNLAQETCVSIVFLLPCCPPPGPRK